MSPQNDRRPLLPDLDLILVEGGSFTMGDEKDERSELQIEISSFYIGKYPVTQGLWQHIMGNNPSRFSGDRRPVENVSWNDARDFIKKLNKETSKTFRLPSEAEWEYAARGGRYSQGYTYAGSDKLKQVGWYRENSDRETHDVGLLLANELDIYDMSGNIWEWCEDDYHANLEDAPKDGCAWIDRPNRGADRVIRGGSCFSHAVGCRPASRGRLAPGYRLGRYGFRVVLPLQSVG